LVEEFFSFVSTGAFAEFFDNGELISSSTAPSTPPANSTPSVWREYFSTSFGLLIKDLEKLRDNPNTTNKLKFCISGILNEMKGNL
jgi:hypothetical protein